MVRLVFHGFLLACAATGGAAGFLLARPAPATLELHVSRGFADAVTIVAGDRRIPIGAVGGELQSVGEVRVRSVELPRGSYEVRVDYLDHGAPRTMKLGRVAPASFRRIELETTSPAQSSAEPPRTPARVDATPRPSPFGSPLLRP